MVSLKPLVGETRDRDSGPQPLAALGGCAYAGRLECLLRANTWPLRVNVTAHGPPASLRVSSTCGSPKPTGMMSMSSTNAGQSLIPPGAW